jgi:prepilin-type N-terminal cleavage/methylation domain-containing protein
MSGTAGAPRGFTLVEVTIALVLAAFVTAAALQGMGWLVSLARVQMEREEAQQGARVVAQLLAAELRAVPEAGLLVATPDSAVLRSVRAWAIVCGPIDGGAAMLLPTSPAVPVLEMLGGGIDSAAIAVPGSGWSVRAAEPWHAADATAAAVARCGTLQPLGGDGTWAARAFRMESLPAGSATATAYLFETVRYTTRRAAGNHWVYRSFGSVNNLQPLAGPVDSLDGFRLDWLDSDGQPAATPAEARGARIRIVAASRHRGSRTAARDTLHAAAMMRSIP